MVRSPDPLGRCCETVTREESSQSLRHAAGILHVQQVRRIGKDERLDVREPCEQEFPSFAEDLTAERSQDREHRLGDAPRLVLGK
jgi:hypothetical protein